jgi:hypothetical protein
MKLKELLDILTKLQSAVGEDAVVCLKDVEGDCLDLSSVVSETTFEDGEVASYIVLEV